MEMIRSKAEVLEYLEKIGYDRPYRIAVEGLIFSPEGRILLERRGKKCKDEIGKLEGVGGGIDHHEDLHEALQEEISQELGTPMHRFKAEIDRLLEIRCVQFEEVGKGTQDWVVVSYLCRWVDGRPFIAEKDKIEELVFLTLDELYAKSEDELSRSTVAAIQAYRPIYGNQPYFEVAENGQ